MSGPKTRNRLVNWVYALACGYFWLPCPLCGRMFGGHEAARTTLRCSSPFIGQMVCWRCNDEARTRSLPMLKAYGVERDDD